MDYFDLHCDTPYECYCKERPFYRSGLAVAGEMGANFNRWSQCFAVWIRDDAQEPYSLYRRILSDFKEKFRLLPQNLTPLLTVEGGAVLEECAERLEELHRDGVRAMTLTWNGENRIAGGMRSDAPLTDFGSRVIAEMNRLHMACDLSHLNVKSFYAAIERAAYPIATHSNSRAVCDHPRNLNDDQLRLIAEKGGVVGLCFYPVFLGGDVFEKLYENIVHMLELDFENHIAVGSDFDGAEMSPLLATLEQVPALRAYLQTRGIGESVLNKIFYGNANRFFARL